MIELNYETGVATTKRAVKPTLSRIFHDRGLNKESPICLENLLYLTQSRLFLVFLVVFSVKVEHGRMLFDSVPKPDHKTFQLVFLLSFPSRRNGISNGKRKKLIQML